MTTESTDKKLIDHAITWLNGAIDINREQSRLHVRYAAYAVVVGIFGFSSSLFYADFAYPTRSDIPDQLEDMPFIILSVSGVVSIFFLSLYRRSLVIIERYEHQILGLSRVRIAANNYDNDGFKSEVRLALTEGAFDSPIAKKGRVESPLPGHPGSDLTAEMVNRLLDIVESNAKK